MSAIKCKFNHRINGHKSKESKLEEFERGIMKNFVFDRLLYDATHDIISQVKELLKTKLLYYIEITDLIRLVDVEVMKRFFKNIPLKTASDAPILSYFDAITNNQINYFDITTYKNTYIIMSVLSKTDEKRTFLITLNNKKCRDHVKSFIEYINNLHNKMRKRSYANNIYAKLDGSYPRYYIGKPLRSFDNVFINNRCKDELISSIRNFIDNKNFYTNNAIPYHFGIMLYGEPGTGKSSLISAISNYFNIIPYFVNVSDLRDLIHFKDEIRQTFLQDSRLKLLVIEDVDTSEFVRRLPKMLSDNDLDNSSPFDRHEKQEMIKRQRESLSEFINVIDSNNCFENVIWLLTTNKLDDIDEAVLRPGRIDYKMYVGYVTDETFNQFMRYHYHKNIPNYKHVKDKLTFAEMQTDIISSLTFDDMCEKYLK